MASHDRVPLAAGWFRPVTVRLSSGGGVLMFARAEPKKIFSALSGAFVLFAGFSDFPGKVNAGHMTVEAVQIVQNGVTLNASSQELFFHG